MFSNEFKEAFRFISSFTSLISIEVTFSAFLIPEAIDNMPEPVPISKTVLFVKSASNIKRRQS